MLATPTSAAARPASFMAPRKGEKLVATPSRLISSMRRITRRSSGRAVSKPPATPALAITRSGAPKRASQSAPTAAMAAASLTSGV